MSNAICQIPGCRNEAGAVGTAIENGEIVDFAYCDRHFDHLGMDYLVPDTARLANTICEEFETCILTKLIFIYNPESYTLVLKSIESERYFVLHTGYVELCSVLGAVKSSSPNLTYSFISRLLYELDTQISEVRFDSYDTNVKSYVSRVILKNNSNFIKLVCRGSDAVGLAYANNIQIKVATSYLGYCQHSL